MAIHVLFRNRCVGYNSLKICQANPSAGSEVGMVPTVDDHSDAVR
jgi:hypothetical protein